MEETTEAKRSFYRYLKMGPKRSLHKLAKYECAKGISQGKVKTRLKLLEKWSSEHNWQQRVKDKITEEEERLRSQMQEHMVQFRETVLMSIKDGIVDYVQRVRSGEAMVEDARDFENLIRLAFMLSGQPLSERVEQEVIHRGHSLIAAAGDDEEATELLAELTGKLANSPSESGGSDV